MTYLATDEDLEEYSEALMSGDRTASVWNRTVPSFGLSRWKHEAVLHILRLGNLPGDWDSYGSPTPSNSVVDRALSLLGEIPFEDLPEPVVAPVAGGGIQFEWSVDNRELELEITPDGDLEFLLVENGQPHGEGAVTSFTRLRWLLMWLQKGHGRSPLENLPLSLRSYIQFFVQKLLGRHAGPGR